MRAPIISCATVVAHRRQGVHHLPHSRGSDVWPVETRHEKKGGKRLKRDSGRKQKKRNEQGGSELRSKGGEEGGNENEDLVL